MADSVTNAPAPESKRPTMTSTTWFKADGSEADSPLDSVAYVTFKLDALGEEHKGWTFDFTKAREAMEAYGLDAGYTNSVIAYGGFGYKTKQTNEASGVRNDKKLADSEKTPEAQAAALDEHESEVNAGNWRAPRGEGGENIPGNADLAQAVFNYQVAKGKQDANLESILGNIKKMDAEGKKKYRNNPEIKVALQEIRLARLKAKQAKPVEGAASDDDLMAA